MSTPDTVAPDTLRLWSTLPQFVQDGDAANNYLFLTWLDGIGQQQQLIDNLCRDNGNVPGWSIILDVSRCPTYALPWLAQFVGVRFTSNQIGNDLAMRNAILAEGNFSRGTPAAVAAAVAQYLGVGGFVQIIERYPDPYSFTIKVFGAEGALTYAELAADDPTYPDVTADYATYGDFPTNNTGIIDQAIIAATPGGLIANILIEV